MTQPRPVSGRQFEITHGRARARIGAVAAVLREFSVDGVAFTETWPDDLVAPMGCGMVLVPWPNRVDGGKWEHDGKTQQLDLTDPGNGHATHGLLRNTAYELVTQTESAVTLAASVYPQHGYPFTLDTSVTYAIGPDGLTVTHQIANVGSQAAPFGVGAHPYLRVGDVPAADLRLTLSARSCTPTNERLLPEPQQSLDGSPWDLRGGRRVGDLDFNLAFTDFAATPSANGRVEHALDAPDGTGLRLWADEVFGWLMVYTPDNFPGSGPESERRHAVALEPMTCPANALASKVDLLTVAPGESWSASWGLRPVGF